jgi:hypothetical protein
VEVRNQHRQMRAAGVGAVLVGLCAVAAWLTHGRVGGDVIWAAVLMFLAGYYVREVLA